MRYMVGSALVISTARSTRLLAGTGVFYSYRIRVKGEIAYTDDFLPDLTRPAFNTTFYSAPTPWSRLLYLIHPAVRRRQDRKRARCFRAPFDLTITYKQLAVSSSPNCHSDENVLAIEGFHHLNALYRELPFPPLRTPDREYGRACGKIESASVALDPMGFTYERLLTLPQRNSA